MVIPRPKILNPVIGLPKRPPRFLKKATSQTRKESQCLGYYNKSPTCSSAAHAAAFMDVLAPTSTNIEGDTSAITATGSHKGEWYDNGE